MQRAEPAAAGPPAPMIPGEDPKPRDAARAPVASLEPRSRGEGGLPLPRAATPAVLVPPEPQKSEEPQSSEEPRIEVRIGRIELRTAPPPPPAPAPAPAARRGFEEFAAKRRYRDRKWY